MERFDSIDEVLDFAIAQERQAAEFYTDLAKKIDDAAMRDVFEGFAGQERGHEELLLRIKSEKSLVPAATATVDLKIADYMVCDAGSPKDIQDAYLIAIKKEQAAFAMYTRLAQLAPSESLCSTLSGLAAEESAHKLKIELEYEQRFMGEN